MHGLLRRCRRTGKGREADTASVCIVGAPAASDDGTGCTGLGIAADRPVGGAVGRVVDALVAGDGERAAPGVRVAIAFAGDVRAADSGEGIAVDAQTRPVVALRSRRLRLTVREIGTGDARQKCAPHGVPCRATGAEATR